MTDRATIAARALPLIDLTDLSGTLDATGAARLCARARTPKGPVAAVCLWPAFVAQAKTALADSGIRLATVVNFPAGGEATLDVVAQTQAAVADGADEIDLVIAYEALRAGRGGFVETQIGRVRAACPAPVRLKTILETGKLSDPALIRRAADIAIGAGADFIKTSTGKVPINATPEAARVMLEAIRDCGRPVGLKPSGGIRSVAEAGVYLDLADAIMGAGWASPDTFRFGASGLLDDVLAALDGGVAGAGNGY